MMRNGNLAQIGVAGGVSNFVKKPFHAQFARGTL
jgi:hypothetical protein